MRCRRRFGGPGGKIDNLLSAYKNSAPGFNIVGTQFGQFKSQPHSLTPSGSYWAAQTNGRC